MTIAPRNKTIQLQRKEFLFYRKKLISLSSPSMQKEVLNKTICQDVNEAISFLPSRFVDLLFLDPPYNLTKQFRSLRFSAAPSDEYAQWMESWLSPMLRLLKPTASIYLCGDWRSSSAIQHVAEKYFIVRNRITWEREKGRGAKVNWKNASEDIWFCTMSNKFTFHLNAVKLKRRVIAPYRENGTPKDWQKTKNGNFRITHPSNIWTDITVPFWSMPENTEHPTQKPEKLLAKIILASTKKDDIVFDPFLGSGTTSVVAKKLGRRYVGIERDEIYACLAEKRLALAETEKEIQGFRGGVFWERNSL